MSAENIRQRPLRRQKLLKGFARRNGGAIEPVVFENVSESGCCIRGDYRIGEWLVVTIPSVGTSSAQVRWSIGGKAGLKLDKEA